MSDLRPCPACEATYLDAYSQDEWHVATCDSRALTYLRNPVAVVHIGTRPGPETFIRVDLLPPGMGLGT